LLLFYLNSEIAKQGFGVLWWLS